MKEDERQSLDTATEETPEEGEDKVPGEITMILHELNAGDRDALSKIMPKVYKQLRNTAQHYLNYQSSGHTLQPTALIHEVYLKLHEGKELYFRDRQQFFFFSGMLMRRVLIDYARARNSQKRKPEEVVVSFDESQDVFGRPDIDLPTLLTLDKLLNRLSRMDPRQGQIVELRFFAGMSLDEVSEVMNISRATIKREWRTARMWLARELKNKAPET
ncbi:MAG: ECF-type sigma factor [Acidobacteriota bacterium]|nr:ECF-type sigma factor [Acidobacteriota bacterium]